MADLDRSFWFCLAHKRVESYEESDSPDRLGPFATAGEAQDALQTIAARNEKYDKEEAEWEGDS